MARPPLPLDGFISYFQTYFFCVKVEDECLRLGGRHLEKDGSDVPDDHGERKCFFCVPGVWNREAKP